MAAPPRPPPPDSVIAEAREALERGRPWQASRLITPVLADSAHRTPAAVFLAATAASRWGGWPEVSRLLTGEPWLDSLYEGRGRLLLARAALELRADSLALRDALAVPIAHDSVEGERLVLLAAALDRLDARDSSASTYERAALHYPLIADWLLIRAAAVTDDSAGRARLYARLRDPLARTRIPWSEAVRSRAHRRSPGCGTTLRGARRSRRALASQVRGESRQRHSQGVRRDLVTLVTARHSVAEVRDAIAFLDSTFTPLSPKEELAVARAASWAGPPGRAVDGYARAFAAKLGDDKDRFDYATALGKVGRYADAAFQFNLVRVTA